VLDFILPWHRRRRGGHANTEERVLFVANLSQIDPRSCVIEFRIGSRFTHEKRLPTGDIGEVDARVLRKVATAYLIATGVSEDKPASVRRKRRIHIMARMSDDIPPAAAIRPHDPDASELGIGPRRVGNPLSIARIGGEELEAFVLRQSLRRAVGKLAGVEMSKRTVNDGAAVG
jgi:hypothetical protein